MNYFALTPQLKDQLHALEHEFFRCISQSLIEDKNQHGLYFKQFGPYRTMINRTVPWYFANKVIGPYDESFVRWKEEIIDWYKSHLEFCNFSFIPYLDNIEIINSLIQDGFSLGGYHGYWIKNIEGDNIVLDIGIGNTITEVDGGNEQDFLEVAMAAFNLKGDDILGPVFHDLFTSGFSTKNTYNFIYSHKKKAVGTGTLFVHKNMAFMANGSVLEEYRGRQIQQEMVQHRIKYAQSCGAEYVVTTTGIDTTSGRNMERQGFKQAFVEEEFVKRFD